MGRHALASVHYIFMCIWSEEDTYKCMCLFEFRLQVSCGLTVLCFYRGRRLIGFRVSTLKYQNPN